MTYNFSADKLPDIIASYFKDLFPDESFKSSFLNDLTIDSLIDLKYSNTKLFSFIINDEACFKRLIVQQDYEEYSLFDVISSGIFEIEEQKKTAYHIFFEEVYPSLNYKALLKLVKSINSYEIYPLFKNFYKILEKNPFFLSAIKNLSLDFLCHESKQTRDVFFQAYPLLEPIYWLGQFTQLNQPALLYKILDGSIINLINKSKGISPLGMHILFFLDEPFYERVYLASPERKIQLLGELKTIKLNFSGFIRWMSETAVCLDEFAKVINLPLDIIVDMSLFQEADFLSEEYAALMRKNPPLALHLFQLYLNYISKKALNPYYISDQLVTGIANMRLDFKYWDWKANSPLKKLIALGASPQGIIMLSESPHFVFWQLEEEVIKNILKKFYKGNVLDVKTICTIKNTSLLCAFIKLSEDIAVDILEAYPSFMKKFKPLSRYSTYGLLKSYHPEIYRALGQFFLEYYLRETRLLRNLINLTDGCEFIGSQFIKSLRNETIDFSEFTNKFKLSRYQHNTPFTAFIKIHFEENLWRLPYSGHPYFNIQTLKLVQIFSGAIDILTKRNPFLERTHLNKQENLLSLVSLLNNIHHDLLEQLNHNGAPSFS